MNSPQQCALLAVMMEMSIVNELTIAASPIGDDDGEDVKEVRQVHLPPAAKRIGTGVATKAVHVVSVRVAVHGLLCPVIGALFGNLVDCYINW